MQTPVPLPAVVRLAPGVSARVVAVARVTRAGADIAALRGPLQQFFGNTVSVGILKQCDDLVLLSLTALRDAITAFGITPERQAGWGVVANPRRAGQARMTETITKFLTNGAWSVSPHVIPHCLLHSLSGILSQALALNGPNMGVGGVPDTEEDVCLGMAAWLAGEDATGGWMVWAGWQNDNPEGPDAVGEALVAAVEYTGEPADGETGWRAIDRLAPRGTP